MGEYYPGINQPVKPIKLQVQEFDYYDHNKPAFRRDKPSEEAQLWLDSKINFLNEIMKFLPTQVKYSLDKHFENRKDSVPDYNKRSQAADSVYNKELFNFNSTGNDNTKGLWAGSNSKILDKIFDEEAVIPGIPGEINLGRFSGMAGLPYDGSLGLATLDGHKLSVTAQSGESDLSRMEYKNQRNKEEYYMGANDFLVPTIDNIAGDQYAKHFRQGVNFQPTIFDMQHTAASFDSDEDVMDFLVDVNGDGVADQIDTTGDGNPDDFLNLTENALSTSLYQENYLNEMGVYSPVFDFGDAFNKFMQGSLFSGDKLKNYHYAGHGTEKEKGTYQHLHDMMDSWTDKATTGDFDAFLRKIRIQFSGGDLSLPGFTLKGESEAYIPSIYELARRGLDLSNTNNWSSKDIFYLSMLMLESRRRYTYAMSEIFQTNTDELDIMNLVNLFANEDLWTQFDPVEKQFYIEVKSYRGQAVKMYNYFLPDSVGTEGITDFKALTKPGNKRSLWNVLKAKTDWLKRRAAETFCWNAAEEFYTRSFTQIWHDYHAMIQGRLNDMTLNYFSTDTDLKRLNSEFEYMTHRLQTEKVDFGLYDKFNDAAKTYFSTQEKDINGDFVHPQVKMLHTLIQSMKDATNQSFLTMISASDQLKTTPDDPVTFENFVRTRTKITELNFSGTDQIVGRIRETLKGLVPLMLDSTLDKTEILKDMIGSVGEETDDLFQALSIMKERSSRIFYDMQVINDFNKVQYGEVDKIFYPQSLNVDLANDVVDDKGRSIKTLVKDRIMDLQTAAGTGFNISGLGYYPHRIARSTSRSGYIPRSSRPEITVAEGLNVDQQDVGALSNQQVAFAEFNILDKLYFNMILEMQKMNSFYMMSMFSSPTPRRVVTKNDLARVLGNYETGMTRNQKFFKLDQIWTDLTSASFVEAEGGDRLVIDCSGPDGTLNFEAYETLKTEISSFVQRAAIPASIRKELKSILLPTLNFLAPLEIASKYLANSGASIVSRNFNEDDISRILTNANMQVPSSFIQPFLTNDFYKIGRHEMTISVQGADSIEGNVVNTLCSKIGIAAEDILDIKVIDANEFIEPAVSPATFEAATTIGEKYKYLVSHPPADDVSRYTGAFPPLGAWINKLVTDDYMVPLPAHPGEYRLTGKARLMNVAFSETVGTDYNDWPEIRDLFKSGDKTGLFDQKFADTTADNNLRIELKPGTLAAVQNPLRGIVNTGSISTYFEEEEGLTLEFLPLHKLNNYIQSQGWLLPSGHVRLVPAVSDINPPDGSGVTAGQIRAFLVDCYSKGTEPTAKGQKFLSEINISGGGAFFQGDTINYLDGAESLDLNLSGLNPYRFRFSAAEEDDQDLKINEDLFKLQRYSLQQIVDGYFSEETGTLLDSTDNSILKAIEEGDDAGKEKSLAIDVNSFFGSGEDLDDFMPFIRALSQDPDRNDSDSNGSAIFQMSDDDSEILLDPSVLEILEDGNTGSESFANRLAAQPQSKFSLLMPIVTERSRELFYDPLFAQLNSNKSGVDYSGVSTSIIGAGGNISNLLNNEYTVTDPDDKSQVKTVHFADSFEIEKKTEVFQNVLERSMQEDFKQFSTFFHSLYSRLADPNETFNMTTIGVNNNDILLNRVKNEVPEFDAEKIVASRAEFAKQIGLGPDQNPYNFIQDASRNHEITDVDAFLESVLSGDLSGSAAAREKQRQMLEHALVSAGVLDRVWTVTVGPNLVKQSRLRKGVTIDSFPVIKFSDKDTGATGFFSAAQKEAAVEAINRRYMGDILYEMVHNPAQIKDLEFKIFGNTGYDSKIPVRKAMELLCLDEEFIDTLDQLRFITMNDAQLNENVALLKRASRTGEPVLELSDLNRLMTLPTSKANLQILELTKALDTLDLADIESIREMLDHLVEDKWGIDSNIFNITGLDENYQKLLFTLFYGVSSGFEPMTVNDFKMRVFDSGVNEDHFKRLILKAAGNHKESIEGFLRDAAAFIQAVKTDVGQDVSGHGPQSYPEKDLSSFPGLLNILQKIDRELSVQGDSLSARISVNNSSWSETREASGESTQIRMEDLDGDPNTGVDGREASVSYTVQFSGYVQINYAANVRFDLTSNGYQITTEINDSYDYSHLTCTTTGSSPDTGLSYNMSGSDIFSEARIEGGKAPHSEFPANTQITFNADMDLGYTSDLNTTKASQTFVHSVDGGGNLVDLKQILNPWNMTQTETEIAADPLMHWAMGTWGDSNDQWETAQFGYLYPGGETSFNTLLDEFTRDFISIEPAQNFDDNVVTTGAYDQWVDALVDPRSNLNEEDMQRFLHGSLRQPGSRAPLYDLLIFSKMTVDSPALYLSMLGEKYNFFRQQMIDILSIGSGSNEIEKQQSIKDVLTQEFYMQDEFKPLMMSTEYSERYNYGALQGTIDEQMQRVDYQGTPATMDWYESRGRRVASLSDGVKKDEARPGMDFNRLNYVTANDLKTAKQSINTPATEIKYEDQGEKNKRSRRQLKLEDFQERMFAFNGQVMSQYADDGLFTTESPRFIIRSSANSGALLNSGLLEKIGDGGTGLGMLTNVTCNPTFTRAEGLVDPAILTMSLADFEAAYLTEFEDTAHNANNFFSDNPDENKEFFEELYHVLHNSGWYSSRVGANLNQNHVFINMNAFMMETILANIFISNWNDYMNWDYEQRMKTYQEELEKKQNEEYHEMVMEQKAQQRKAYLKALAQKR